MNVIFRCSRRFLDDARRDLARPHRFAAERVGFITVRPAATARSLILIAESYYPVADADYLDDPSVGAMMGPEAIRKALEMALLQNVGMFHVHMHEHSGRPGFSSTDLREQTKFIPDFFTICSSMPHGALVLSHDRAAGRMWTDPSQILSIDETNVVGSPMIFDMMPANTPAAATADDLSRQSFLGRNSNSLLANTRALVVGIGGGGSHIAQQLAHIGVGEIRVVDPQEIEASNLNRLVGATARDVETEMSKVKIAERTIRGVRPWINVVPKQAPWQEVAELLIDAHVVFGCVDGYRQRMYLEAAARRYCVPYIDVGMDVAKLGDNHFAVAGQMITSLPGGPCMKCIGFLTEERLNREENEYGAAGGVPQVVWTNGTLASLAVGAFMRMVTPWFPHSAEYEWLELDGNSQTVSQSEQPKYNIQGPCPHFPAQDQGDPFFTLSALPGRQGQPAEVAAPPCQEQGELVRRTSIGHRLSVPLVWLRHVWRLIFRG
ncbi:MAG: ThiF family adenylyltransferase [Reyranella sp.]|nr:ThiF family adenylyltransferase [Reyranella sp.]